MASSIAIMHGDIPKLRLIIIFINTRVNDDNVTAILERHVNIIIMFLKDLTNK